MKNEILSLEDWKSYREQLIRGMKVNSMALINDKMMLKIVDRKIKELTLDEWKEKREEKIKENGLG